jgi:hypothetical protein
VSVAVPLADGVLLAAAVVEEEAVGADVLLPDADAIADAEALPVAEELPEAAPETVAAPEPEGEAVAEPVAEGDAELDWVAAVLPVRLGDALPVAEEE